MAVPKVYNRVIAESSNTPGATGTVTVELTTPSPNLTFVGGGTSAGVLFSAVHSNGDLIWCHIYQKNDPSKWCYALCTYVSASDDLTFSAADVLSGSAGAATLVTWTDVVVASVEIGAQFANNMASFEAAFIVGCEVVWDSGTGITVKSGAMYIEGEKRIVEFPSDLSLSSLSLSTSSWYYVYGYLSSGTPAVEIVTTAPASPYARKARSKTSDTSRRFLGALKTNSSGALLSFKHAPQVALLVWRTKTADTAFGRVLNGGTATTATNFSMSQAVPSFSETAFTRLTAITQSAYFGHPGDTVAGSGTADQLAAVSAGGTLATFFPVDSSQNGKYLVTSGGSAYVDVYGYVLER